MKRAGSNSPFHSTRTEAFGADLHPPGLVTAKVDLYALEVNTPGSPGVAVGMADTISRHPSSSAGFANVCHFYPSCRALSQANGKHCTTVQQKGARRGFLVVSLTGKNVRILLTEVEVNVFLR